MVSKVQVIRVEHLEKVLTQNLEPEGVAKKAPT
jgi:hypothetical protein